MQVDEADEKAKDQFKFKQLDGASGNYSDLKLTDNSLSLAKLEESLKSGISDRDRRSSIGWVTQGLWQNQNAVSLEDVKMKMEQEQRRKQIED